MRFKLLRQVKSSDSYIQISLFEDQKPIKGNIVNVASGKQLSPFRYPGGKTWLVPTVRSWLKSLPNKP